MHQKVKILFSLNNICERRSARNTVSSLNTQTTGVDYMSKTIYTKDPARFYVYAFLREDGTPYYIGKGQGNRAWGKRRRISPPADSSRIIILFENLTETEAFSEEIRLINFYGRKDLGTGILRNLTDGGEGSSGYKHTQDALDKMSAAQSGEKSYNYGRTGEKSPSFGKKHTAEARAKMSAANTGKKQTPETIAKRSAANTGKKRTQEARAKQSAANTGKRHTPESLDKMSAANTGENNPMFGKCQSPETRAKRLATRKRNKEARIIPNLESASSPITDQI